MNNEWAVGGGGGGRIGGRRGGVVLKIVKCCGGLLMCLKKCVILQSQIWGGRLWRALRLTQRNMELRACHNCNN